MLCVGCGYLTQRCELCEIGGCSRGDKEEGQDHFGLERREEEVNPWQRDLDPCEGEMLEACGVGRAFERRAEPEVGARC